MHLCGREGHSLSPTGAKSLGATTTDVDECAALLLLIVTLLILLQIMFADFLVDLKLPVGTVV